MSVLDRVTKQRNEARDVKIPDIVNPKRRKRCSKKLMTFATTYFKHLYTLKLAPFQIDRFKRTQETIQYGGNKADAQPRGSGKTTEAYVTAIWATLTGRKKFFLVCKGSDAEACSIINNIKFELLSNELLLEDFPEVCAPIVAMAGVPQRTKSQTSGTIPTLIEWKANTIRLPTIKDSISSGALLMGVGLDGQIRGKMSRGMRPDFVLIDDPESRSSVKSPAIQEKLERTILEDIGGLAGPGKGTSTLWRGTIIKKDCLVDQYTNRDLHPEWVGNKQSALIKYPIHTEMWDEYHEIMRQNMKDGDFSGRGANKFYLDNREKMDEGAEVAWEANYVKDKAPDKTQIENSALQNLYNNIFKWGEEAFASEYQNNPIDTRITQDEIIPEDVMDRVNGTPFQLVPKDYNRIIRYIDVGARECHYVVMAVDENTCKTAIIDYATIETGVIKDVKVKNASGKLLQSIEQSILNTLRLLRDEEIGGLYCSAETGEIMYVDLTLVDSGYMEGVITRFIKESGNKFRMTKGTGSNKGKKFVRPKNSNNEYVQTHWYTSRQSTGVSLCILDADHWKYITHQRFLQTVESDGACTLYGESRSQHRTFAKSICAERWSVENNKWELTNTFNHFLDACAGCYCALDMLGIRLVPLKVIRKKLNTTSIVKKQKAQRRRPNIRTRY